MGIRKWQRIINRNQDKGMGKQIKGTIKDVG